MARLALDDRPRWSGRVSRGTVAACLIAAQVVVALVLVSYRAGLRQATGQALPPEFAAVSQLYERIRRDAVRVPPDGELAQGAVEGMIGALDDPYAAYFDAADFAVFARMLDGRFSGVGVQIQDGDQGPVIVSVFDGTPAAEAGIVVGERIVSVDGKDVRDTPTESVAALVTGEAGTAVSIGLEGGPAGPRVLRLTRADILLPDVESRLEDGDIGYVSLVQFSNNAGIRVRAAALDLANQGARGIVLDLRGNPGGLLGEAVEVASVFVEDGTLVSVRGRAGSGADRLYEAEGDALDSLPLVVLVDEWSASASEIVAAAVQDLKRGQIIGETTYGKGSVQSIEVLGNGGVKLTTAEYLTSSGRSIEGVGVVPDLEVSGDDAQLAAARATLRQLFAASGAAQ
ncbi:MAG: S41 family peptidase [Egibacteraceae bacterium]